MSSPVAGTVAEGVQPLDAARRHRGGAGPRLRGPVLAADRAPHPRVRRLLGAAAARRAARGAARRAGRAAWCCPAGPSSVYSEDAPPLRRELLDLGIPVLGICYGMQAMALELGGKVEGAEVAEFGRTDLHVRDAGPAARRPAARADVLDEPPRHGLRSARRVHRAGLVAGVTGRGVRVGRARPVRHPVPPRGRAHAARHAGAAHVPARRVRLRAGVDPGVDRRRADCADPRAGGRRPRDLRAVRRRRLLRRRADRAPRARRPARLRAGRPRAAAQGRGRAGGAHVPRALRRAARARGRARALPRAARRRDRPGAEAPHHRRGVHPRVRGGGGEARRRRLPRPGHALFRRDRVRRRRQRRRGDDQVAPQRGRAPRALRLRPDRAAAPAVQGRGARRGRGPGHARPARVAPAVPRARASRSA